MIEGGDHKIGHLFLWTANCLFAGKVTLESNITYFGKFVFLISVLTIM